MQAIKVDNLKKSYVKGALVVDGVTFSVDEGKFFAFLGPNGAGKSTTINCICTLLPFDSGTIEVCGRDVKRCTRSPP